ncbi:hypothetical protein [Marinobacter adhaerens]|uniref:hypothetical protein n=1 Tax=Marinobacter adhaerens TaxID=1033846 RepID=UPI003D29AAAB
MLEDPQAVIAVAGGVSGVGGLVGSIIGNRVDVRWIQKKLKELDDKIRRHEDVHRDYDKLHGEHRLEIELIKQRGNAQ